MSCTVFVYFPQLFNVILVSILKEKLRTLQYWSRKALGVLSADKENEAKAHWDTDYDWRKTERRINSFPNFVATIPHDGFDFRVHFVALCSARTDAVPLVLLHGWPGSFLEFLGILDVLRKKYPTANDLPFHIIVPSLPGYGYSNGPPLDHDFTIQGIAAVIDELMIGLGFGGGYITQGGDIGSFVSRVLGATSFACKGVHLNLCNDVDESKAIPISSLPPAQQQGLQRARDFRQLGNAYAREHGTRPATIGLVLSSSPLALLAWIGEKFLQWTDTTPPLDEILDGVTLYWFTESFPRSIYPYRQMFAADPVRFHGDPKFRIRKPTGYSWHPRELAPVPPAWVARTCQLVWSRTHSEGGHFAAPERPAAFVEDIEDFVRKAWPRARL